MMLRLGFGKAHLLAPIKRSTLSHTLAHLRTGHFSCIDALARYEGFSSQQQYITSCLVPQASCLIPGMRRYHMVHVGHSEVMLIRLHIHTWRWRASTAIL